MKIQFSKYHGAGNDFVLVDDRKLTFPSSEKIVRKICDRHLGIGADGLLLLRNKTGYDFEMIYFNSDGKLATMCGNGSRCMTAFAFALGIVQNKQAVFVAADGEHEAILESPSVQVIKVRMGEISTIESTVDYIFMNTGSPHYIMFTQNADAVDLLKEARRIRYSDRFKAEGTNVNFVQRDDEGIYVRTYERGVEDETLSCGTGVIASALAALERGIIPSGNGLVKIRTRGGNLKVSYEKSGGVYRNIWLEGPVQHVFNGEFEI